MFTDRPYDGFSIVSTGIKCMLQASRQFRRVLPRQFPNMNHIWSLVDGRA